uniref:RNA 2',3'-cyclic phosphodiesterase n=1 Tax=candidate division WOR-3 bacterium TaxID=2052148 RepID=A0A7V3RHU9_UNCW3
MRTFIGIEIPERQRKVIYEFWKEERSKNLPIKWVEFENLHITLKFLGEVDEKRMNEIIPALSSISKKTKGFLCQLENFGCFPGIRNPRVLWMGVSQGEREIINLAIELDDALSKYGFKKEEKKFHPHLTLGRIRAPFKIDEIIDKNLKTESFRVNDFVLFKSTLLPSGPIYERLKTFDLI